jgi:putative endonuclease
LSLRSVGMTKARQELGKWAEDLAVMELERRGYAIVARGYRTRHGEIDVVAWAGETLVFIEVRCRSGEGCGAAAESVTREKQRRVVRMAIDYLARHDLYERCAVRFDVMAIDEHPDGGHDLAVIEAAFDGW